MDYPDYFAEKFIELNVRGDEWIEGFIPKELFTTPCSKFCFGAAYSFVVVNDGEFVYVTFLNTAFEINETDGVTEIRLKPLFNYVYWYDETRNEINPRISS